MAKPVTAEIKGGEALTRYLKSIERKLRKAAAVNVGFLEGAKYSGVHPIRGTKRFEGPVAQVAFWNEFGTTTAPPRPFFRGMIEENSGDWGNLLGEALAHNDYDLGQSLEILGTVIKDQLVQSIVNFSTPANAKRTVQIKGFDKPLIDDGFMQRSVSYEVVSS